MTPRKKLVVIKLTLDLNRTAVPNLTQEYQTIFHEGMVEQYFKWISNLKKKMSNYKVREKYSMALKTLKGSDRETFG
jgi:hypothetical protein